MRIREDFLNADPEHCSNREGCLLSKEGAKVDREHRRAGLTFPSQTLSYEDTRAGNTALFPSYEHKLKNEDHRAGSK